HLDDRIVRIARRGWVGAAAEPDHRVEQQCEHEHADDRAQRQQPIVVKADGFLADRSDLHLDALATIGLADARRRDRMADRAADALLEGHFILSSGLRSPRYLQCARVLMDPTRAERLARALAAKLPADLRNQVDAVVSPAMGGVIIGHEMGRALGRPAMFVERPQGTFELRRGFRLKPGERVLLVEDVVTTGLSSREAIAAIEASGGKVIGAASLVDRSGGNADLGVPYTPLIRIDLPAYSAAAF